MLPMKNGKTQMASTKYKRLNQLTHEEKMEIYNLVNTGLYFKKEIGKKFNITGEMVNKVVKEIHDLIRYKIYGEPPKQPKFCNLCGGKVRFNRYDREKSRSGFVYYCTQCHAWVSTSPRNPREALGELANKEMRKRRRELHQWFDKLWKGHSEREMYYDKLAAELGKSECHFSQMSMKELEKAEKIVKKWWLEKYDR